MSESEMGRFKPQARPEITLNDHHQDEPMAKVHDALTHQSEPKLRGNIRGALRSLLNPLIGREHVGNSKRIEPIDLTHRRIIRK